MGELLDVQLFVRVVEEGSFSAAARFFGITPSAVSRQVSQLELELGARLLHRTTRKQTLTEAGQIYFLRARRIAADLEDARLAVRRLTDTPSGNLHITVEADFALAFIAPVLAEFLECYPEVQLRVSMAAGIVDLVDSGIDLAIRIGHLGDSSLVARKIAMSESTICASPTYLEKRGTPNHPGELSTHSCLSFRVRPGRNDWRFKLPQGPLDVAISGRVNANSLVFLRHAALQGLGVVMIPTWIVQKELEEGTLVPLLEDFSTDPPNSPIHVVFAHNRHLAPKVRAFVDFIAERMEST